MEPYEMNQHMRDQHNLAMRSWVIDYVTNFLANFSGENQFCTPPRSRSWGATYIKFEHVK